MEIPVGDTMLDARNRAILKLFRHSVARLGAGRSLKVSDFYQDGDRDCEVRVSAIRGVNRNPVEWLAERAPITIQHRILAIE